MKSGKYFGALIAVVFAFGAVAYAGSDQAKLGKSSYFTLTRETMIGSTVLSPGEYEVRDRRSTNTHYVEFTRVVQNHMSQDALSPYESEVVAEVPCTMQSLKQPAAETQVGTTGPYITSVSIRGETVQHNFEPGPDPSAPQNHIEYGGGGGM